MSLSSSQCHIPGLQGYARIACDWQIGFSSLLAVLRMAGFQKHLASPQDPLNELTGKLDQESGHSRVHPQSSANPAPG